MNVIILISKCKKRKEGNYYFRYSGFLWGAKITEVEVFNIDEKLSVNEYYKMLLNVESISNGKLRATKLKMQLIN